MFNERKGVLFIVESCHAAALLRFLSSFYIMRYIEPGMMLEVTKGFGGSGLVSASFISQPNSVDEHHQQEVSFVLIFPARGRGLPPAVHRFPLVTACQGDRVLSVEHSSEPLNYWEPGDPFSFPGRKTSLCWFPWCSCQLQLQLPLPPPPICVAL